MRRACRVSELSPGAVRSRQAAECRAHGAIAGESAGRDQGLTRRAPRGETSVDIGLRHGLRVAGLEEVEIAAVIGLCDVLLIEHRPAALVFAWRGLPCGAAARELRVAHVQ